MLLDEGLDLLDEDECLKLLGSVSIGRVGVSVGALPAIFPVNYVLLDGAIVFRTGAGTKLAAATDHVVVAFEVDSFDSLHQSGWSVLVVGAAVVVTDPADLQAAGRLALQPWVDGMRDHYVRLPVEFVSGRRIVHLPESEESS